MRKLLKVAIGALMLANAGLVLAVPTLVGDTVTLAAGASSGLTIEITTPSGSSPQSTTVTVSGPEFSVCVYETATGACTVAGGLIIDIDIGDTSIAFTFDGSMGTSGADFTLSLSDLDFTPVATIATPGGSFSPDDQAVFIGFSNGEFQFTSNTADSLVFGGFDIVVDPVTAIFNIKLESNDVPEPGALALLGLGLAGLGFSRRRSAR